MTPPSANSNGRNPPRSKGSGRSSLIPAERQARVIEIVRREGVASIHRIAAAIEASPSTVRRDLDELTEQGYLERTHGGAVFRSQQHTTFEPRREIAEQTSVPAKAAIGRHAAGMVRAGHSVVFDSSSTVFEVARRIAERAIKITAVTNDLGIAHTLARTDAVKLIVPGGTLRPGSLTLVGEPGLGVLAALSVDIAFVGVHSLAGLKPTDTSLEIAAIKRALIETAERVVLLADSSKFHNPAFCKVCAIERFHELITDQGLKQRDRRALKERGVEVTVVRSEERS